MRIFGFFSYKIKLCIFENVRQKKMTVKM